MPVLRLILLVFCVLMAVVRVTIEGFCGMFAREMVWEFFCWIFEVAMELRQN
jgi:hypothetical protein